MRRYMSRSGLFLPLFFSFGGLVGAFLFVFSGCGTEPPPPWPWWTTQDSTAVETELAGWKDVLDPTAGIAGLVADTWRGQIRLADSTSEKGDTLYKFARLLSVEIEVESAGHANVMQFGVTVDTLPMKDTFCEVTYRDSSLLTRARFTYDSLWVIGFRPDTQISGSPPETTIIYRPSYTERRGFAIPQTAVKTFAWTAMRKVFLVRDTLKDTLFYTLRKLTGVAAYVPSATDAPNINRVIFSRLGGIDTVFYAPRQDGRGLYNLKEPASLYTVAAGERVTVAVTTTTPVDTAVDKNRFFLIVSGRAKDITLNARRGEGSFAFADTGLQHVYVRVVPLSNLLYPTVKYTGTFWAIPVRVVNQ